MNLPFITEAEIRSRTTEQSWARGENYYSGNDVDEIVLRDETITAEVAGSGYEPYEVKVHLSANGIASAWCSCPYDWGGDCKHIVATLLHLVHARDKIAKRPGLDVLLEGLGREELAALVKALAAEHPKIVKDIEGFTPPSSAPPPSILTPPVALAAVDTGLLRRQIKADLRGSINSGYDQWGDSFYDSDLSAVLNPALERARAYLDAGQARHALALLEAATAAWDDSIEGLDEYAIEYFEDVAEDFTGELGEVWTEAILSADLTEAELAEWHEKLDEMADDVFGGSSLEIAATAAEHGWSYPPLVAAMQGNITEKGAWEGEPPFFADELAKIRLRILERQERYPEYLNLAQAEGEFILYLLMLIRQGQGQKAFDESIAYLVQPSGIETVGKALAEHGETKLALRLGEHGLELTEQRGKASLAAWLSDLTRAEGRTDLALRAAQIALTAQTDLANYRRLQASAGTAWDEMRAGVLAEVAHSHNAQGSVDIYLHEGMHDEAIAVVDAGRGFYDIDKVIEAVKTTHPRWAFAQCLQGAEAIMDAGQSSKYDVAVSWLRRGRDILRAAGQEDEWVSYLGTMMEKHQRKYKLIPMLKALR